MNSKGRGKKKVKENIGRNDAWRMTKKKGIIKKEHTLLILPLRKW